MAGNIVYEIPLNERIRTFLRFEQLMQRFEFYLEGNTQWHTHGAIYTLIEILNLTSRADLKTELIKELDRQFSNLAQLSDKPGVDKSQLQRIVSNQKKHLDRLHTMTGQLTGEINSNELINSLRNRISMPGGTCDFDLPPYHFWLSTPVGQRHKSLKDWMQPMDDIFAAVKLCLNLIRESVAPRSMVATQGFYQQNLDANLPVQMIRVILPARSQYFPETSAGKHRFSIRFFLQGDVETRASQCKDDIDFQLACCTL